MLRTMWECLGCAWNGAQAWNRWRSKVKRVGGGQLMNFNGFCCVYIVLSRGSWENTVLPWHNFSTAIGCSASLHLTVLSSCVLLAVFTLNLSSLLVFFLHFFWKNRWGYVAHELDCFPVTQPTVWNHWRKRNARLQPNKITHWPYTVLILDFLDTVPKQRTSPTDLTLSWSWTSWYCLQPTTSPTDLTLPWSWTSLIPSPGPVRAPGP